MWIMMQTFCDILGHKISLSKSKAFFSKNVNFAKATIDHDGSSTTHQQFQPLDLHIEIGEGISNTNVI